MLGRILNIRDKSNVEFVDQDFLLKNTDKSRKPLRQYEIDDILSNAAKSDVDNQMWKDDEILEEQHLDCKYFYLF